MGGMMDIFINILLFLHFFGLVIGMGSGIALSTVSRLVVNPGAESGFDKVMVALARNGHVGLGLLWLTGLLMVWLKYEGVGAFDFWFWIKIAFVIVLTASVGIGSAAARRARAGEAGAAGRTKMASMVSGISGLIIIFAAVFAFN
jgi:protoporphyrinogen IX oxidase